MPWESDSEVGSTLHWRNWIHNTDPTNIEPALRKEAGSWYIRLFLNQHRNDLVSDDEFVDALAGTFQELNWAHMYTINARRQGICSKCRRCSLVMRIAWGKDSTIEHMNDARATICAWLGITYQRPPRTVDHPIRNV